MPLHPHPRYAEFRDWFGNQRARAAPIDDVYYRVAGPRHTTAEEIVSGIGARRVGGRWNPPDVMNVVYASCTPMTAMAESVEHFRYYSIPPWEGMPKVTVGIRVVAPVVLNLANPEIAADLPDSIDGLMAEDWRKVREQGDEATTMAMGRAAFEAGIQGLLVVSKPDPAGVNLLVFPENLDSNCQMEVINPELLEKLGKPS